MRTEFKIGETYGDDLQIQVIKRTAKTITIKSIFGTNKVRLASCYEPQGVEAISFKSWLIDAREIQKPKRLILKKA